MISHMTRDEIVAALVRHPDWGLEAASPRDIWALGTGQPVSPDAREVIDRRLEHADSALAIEAEYRDQGIWILTCADESYPQRLRERLGARAPALLYGFGEQSLLETDGIGVVGSRKLSEAGERVTTNLATAIAGAARSLVSGGARGTDRIAMRGALDCGGTAVGVMAHALTGAMRESDNQALAEQGQLCLTTQYQPDMGFTVPNAMARNKIIYALTECTVVVAADLNSGGSWAGATEALRHNLSRVAVWKGDGEGEGNRALSEKGAVAIDEVHQALDRDWLDERLNRMEPQQQLDFGSAFGN